MTDCARYSRNKAPKGGWSSVRSLLKHSIQQDSISSTAGLLLHHDKVGGYLCTSCAWAKPAQAYMAEFCENGAKATFWELTSRRAPPDFFEQRFEAFEEMVGRTG